MSPAWAASIVLPNVSTLVTTDLVAAPSPTSSTGSPTRTWPRSIAPVTTVPRPLIVSEFSTAIRNGAPKYRSGTGTYASTASSRARTEATHRSSPASAASPETRTTGTSSPGYP